MNNSVYFSSGGAVLSNFRPRPQNRALCNGRACPFAHALKIIKPVRPPLLLLLPSAHTAAEGMVANNMLLDPAPCRGSRGALVGVGWFLDATPRFLQTSGGAVWVLGGELRPGERWLCRQLLFGQRGEGPLRLGLVEGYDPHTVRLRLCGGAGAPLELGYRLASEAERALLVGRFWMRRDGGRGGGGGVVE